MNAEQELLERAEQDAAELKERLHAVHQAFREVLAAGLTRRALIILIRGIDPGLRMGDIEAVFNAMGRLDEYLGETETDPPGGGS